MWKLGASLWTSTGDCISDKTKDSKEFWYCEETETYTVEIVETSGEYLLNGDNPTPFRDVRGILPYT